MAKDFKIGNATVRIHGNPDRERIEAATLIFLKAAQQQRKKVRNEARQKTYTGTAQVGSKTGS